MKIDVTIYPKNPEVGSTREMSVECEIIPNVGEEIYIGNVRYVVEYRAFDILNGKLVFSGIVLR